MDTENVSIIQKLIIEQSQKIVMDIVAIILDGQTDIAVDILTDMLMDLVGE
jgi:hypothetical protein